MEIKDIRDLILTIDKTSIQQVEIEKGDIKIKINKGLLNEGIRKAAVLEGKGAEVSEAQKAEVKAEVQLLLQTEKEKADSTYLLKSPMVGTFYCKPSPDSSSYVKAGDRVEKGQTLCIIEAMKMMNEIKSETTGVVVEIMCEDEDILQYGQPIMRIRR